MTTTQTIQRGVSGVARVVRTWSPALKTTLARMACSSITGRVLATIYRNQIPARELVIDTTDPTITPQMKAAIYWGLYESAEQRFVCQYLPNDADVIELGSSVGVVSCLIARLVPPPHQLIFVEANPALHATLRRNLARNAPGRQFTLVRRAISYAESHVSFIAGEDNTVGRVSVATEMSRECFVIETTTLSQILRENNVHEFAMVCDIEGMEADVMQYDAHALARCRRIIIELHDRPAGSTIEEMQRHLECRLGFMLRDRYGPVCVFDRARADSTS